MESAHGVREISDILTFAMLRALMLHKLHQVDTKPVTDLYTSHQPMLEEMHQIQEEWY